MARRGAQARDDQCEGAGTPEHERREAPRFKVTFKLSVFLEHSPGGGVLVVPAVAKDISRVGALVEARQALAAGQLLPSVTAGRKSPKPFSSAATIFLLAWVNVHGRQRQLDRR